MAKPSIRDPFEEPELSAFGKYDHFAGLVQREAAAMRAGKVVGAVEFEFTPLAAGYFALAQQLLELSDEDAANWVAAAGAAVLAARLVCGLRVILEDSASGERRELEFVPPPPNT